MRINSRKNMARAAFIQSKADACRKAGAVRFIIDDRKGGITPAEMVAALERRGLNARCIGRIIIATVERKAA